MPDSAVTLISSKIPLSRVAPDFQAASLVAEIEHDFFHEAWEGARIIIPQENYALAYEVWEPLPVSLKDLQVIAATYRELLQALGVTTAACVINLTITPALPGSLGDMLGYKVLISVLQNGSHFTIKYLPYDQGMGEQPISSNLDSVWKKKIETKLGEPFETFFNRLFYIEV